MISKPVQGPWNDSGKNLVKDIVCNSRGHEFHVMVTAEAKEPCPNAIFEPVYRGRGRYSPGLSQNLRALLRLLRPDRMDIYHFFFAPNPLSSKAGRLVRVLKRRKKMLQTVCSVPATFEGIDRLLFADRVVALSRSTCAALEAHGVKNVVHIPPGIDIRTRVTDEARARVRRDLGLPADKPLVLYAGDYQFSRAADTCLRALPKIMTESDAHFVFACRIKQALSVAEESRIKEAVSRKPWKDRVHFFNERPDIIDLVGAAAIQVLPASSLFAKMDIPLVLLEALREGSAIVVSNGEPLAELVEDGAGLGVPPEDPEALAVAVLSLLGSEEKRLALVQRGRQVLENRFDARVVAAAYGKLYDELLLKP